jgi:IPT/TIG domain
MRKNKLRYFLATAQQRKEYKSGIQALRRCAVAGFFFNKIFCLLGLLLIVLTMLVISCAKSNVWDEPPDTPVIDSIAPAKGRIGTQIRLYGTGFSYKPGENFVKVNGITVRVDSPSSSTVVLATITSVTGTGHVHIAVNNKEADGPIFTYDSAALHINSVTPSIGWVDTVVRIRGTGFGTIPDSVKIYFKTTLAVITQFSDSLIVVRAPDALNQNPGTALVTAVVSGVTSNALPFIYQHRPSITGVINDQWGSGFYYWVAVTGLSPQTVNDKISVNGNPVSIDTILRVGTAEYNQQPVGEKIVVKRNTVDQFLINEAADFVVTVNGQASDPLHFQNKPQITNVTVSNRPAFQVAAGDTATIDGIYFGNQQATSIVEIWRLVHLTPDPVILSWTRTQIKMVMPAYSQPNGASLQLHVKQNGNDGQTDIVYGSAVVGNPGTLYAIGYINGVYKYWKDGTILPLPGCNNAKDIYVSGTDVYVSGEQVQPATSKTSASYWKNGVAIDLTDAVTSVFSSKANSIFVAGTDVYVAGQAVPGSFSHNAAVYWKNGTMVTLSDGTREAFATSIVVSGTDVYVAGMEIIPSNSFGKVIYWKNGVRVDCTDGTQSAYTSAGSGLAISGTDVYVAGGVAVGFTPPNRDEQIAAYWKNGTRVTLSDVTGYANAYGIVVNGGDIYVTGQIYSYLGPPPAAAVAWASYWKNGTRIDLTGNNDGNSVSFSIYVKGADVYVAGATGTATGYWKNAVFTATPSFTMTKLVVQ